MKYKAIFVDLGGVLVLNRAGEVGEYFKKKYALDQDKTKDIFRFIQSGKKSEQEINSFLLSVNVARDIWNEYLSKFIETEVKNDDLFEILNESKTHGIKIIYTSNNSSNIDKILKKYGLDGLPDLIINSSDAGVSKPDLAFWEASFAETNDKWPNIKRSEVLVIDDSGVNCDGAIAYGLAAILYKQGANHEIRQILKV